MAKKDMTPATANPDSSNPGALVKAAADAEAKATGPADPAPGDTINPASGAFVEPDAVAAVDPSHPSVENNPRRGTTAVQNSLDMNEPRPLAPNDPENRAQGIDKGVYGDPKPAA